MPSLTKCRACGETISTKALSCPKCGHPIRRATSPTASGCATIIVLLVFFAFIIHLVSRDDAPPAKAELSDAQCRQDLQCWGDKNAPSVAGPCERQVESNALHSVKWSDGFLTPTFSAYSWKDKATGRINLIGDHVEFQNGFGAMTPMTYVCTFDPAANTVTANVIEGRLRQ